VAGEQPDLNRRHAVIAAGHGEVNGQRAIIIRNSWGERWGDGGCGYLTEKYLVPRVFQLAVLKEDLPVPSQPDCASAWLEAVKMVDSQHGHHGQTRPPAILPASA
jgi:aminopeptidase C